MGKKYRNTYKVLFFTSLFLFFIYIFLSNYPALLFKEKIINENYTIYSDVDLSDKINPILDSVNPSLLKSELYKPLEYKFAFCSSYKKYSFLSNIYYESFAITKPITDFIIITKTNIEENEVISKKGVNNVRKLTSLLVHEMTHILINDHYRFKRFKIPKWKQEGYCEYIANESSFDEEEGINNFKNNLTNNSPSYTYFKYRLYITYLMNIKELSFVQIVEKDINIDELSDEIRLYLNNNDSFFDSGRSIEVQE